MNATPAALAGATATNWLQFFAPAWFSAVMSTGVLAVTLHFYSASAPALAPVGLVVIPVAGAPIAAGLEPAWRELLLVFNWAALGAGSLLYVGVLPLTMFRYVLGKPVGRPLVHGVGQPRPARRHSRQPAEPR
jgi:tellurite resistance protein TehA-like permease